MIIISAFLKSNWEAIVAISSMIIALITYYDSRKNNRLSVKPYLQILRKFDPNEPIGITVTNHGLGLAIIENVTIKVNGKAIPMDQVCYINGVFNFLEFDCDSAVDLNWSCHNLHKDAYIAAGQEVWFLRLNTANLSPGDYKIILAELDKVKILITYKSIYNQHDKSGIDGNLFEKNEG